MNTNPPRTPAVLFFATRPWSFTMTAISVVLGNVVVPADDRFQWVYALVTLGGMIIVHGATNVLNDYFDFRHGVDRPGAPTTIYRRHPLVSGDISPRGLLVFAIVLYALAAACGAYLVVVRGPVVLAIAAIGALASVFYTAGPIRYKYRSMGEVSVFLMWGPLMVLGAFYVQHGTWDRVLPALLVSIPQGLWVALVILANNLKDISFDGESAIRTVAISLGRRKAIALFIALTSAAYAITIICAAAGLFSRWALLVIISVPKTVQLIRHLAGEETIPADADPLTAQNGMIFGLLLVAGLIAGWFIPW